MLVDLVLSLMLLAAILFLMSGIYVATAFLAARSSGWRRLAASYARPISMPVREILRIEKARVGGVTYKNLIGYAPRREGLEITCHFLDRLAHPPLLVPWSAVVDHQILSVGELVAAATAPIGSWFAQLLLRLGPERLQTGSYASPDLSLVRVTISTPSTAIEVELVTDRRHFDSYLNSD